MDIKIGKVYKDGWGHKHIIIDTVKHNKEWVKSSMGAWYRQRDGRIILMNKQDVSVPSIEESSFDLVQEITEQGTV